MAKKKKSKKKDKKSDSKSKKEEKKDEKKETKTKEESKSEKELPKKLEKLVDEISELSVMELSELVEALQDKLGVTAAAPMAAPAGAAGQDQAGAEGGEEGGAQTVVLTGAGDNKISVIKALREINQNWGLKEAKDMVENTPTEIVKDGKPEEVKDAAEKLKEAGGQVELK